MPPKDQNTADNPQSLVPDGDRASSKPSFASEEYNQVARTAKLRALMLTKTNFFVLPMFIVDSEKEIPRSKLVYSCKLSGAIFEKERGFSTCEWNWSVSAKSGRKKSLCIEATYRVIYDNLIDCQEDAVMRYMKRVGRFATYPYFRAHVSQLGWASGANLPILPTIAS